MPDVASLDRRTVRLLELAALLAIVATLVLVIDFFLKQQIVSQAREASDDLHEMRSLADAALGRAPGRPRGGDGDSGDHVGHHGVVVVDDGASSEAG